MCGSIAVDIRFPISPRGGLRFSRKAQLSRLPCAECKPASICTAARMRQAIGEQAREMIEQGALGGKNCKTQGKIPDLPPEVRMVIGAPWAPVAGEPRQIVQSDQLLARARGRYFAGDWGRGRSPEAVPCDGRSVAAIAGARPIMGGGKSPRLRTKCAEFLPLLGGEDAADGKGHLGIGLFQAGTGGVMRSMAPARRTRRVVGLQ